MDEVINLIQMIFDTIWKYLSLIFGLEDNEDSATK